MHAALFVLPHLPSIHLHCNRNESPRKGSVSFTIQLPVSSFLRYGTLLTFVSLWIITRIWFRIGGCCCQDRGRFCNFYRDTKKLIKIANLCTVTNNYENTVQDCRDGGRFCNFDRDTKKFVNIAKFVSL